MALLVVANEVKVPTTSLKKANHQPAAAAVEVIRPSDVIIKKSTTTVDHWRTRITKDLLGKDTNLDMIENRNVRFQQK